MNMIVKHQIQSSGDNTLSTEKNGGMGNNTE
ncbi:methyl-accepting chemotaxis protein [Yersinia enterocolitica]|nr:methyl-accepting chemotaxis protein [Yersinia enterocolitica]